MFEEKKQGWLTGERIHEGSDHLMVIYDVPGTWLLSSTPQAS